MSIKLPSETVFHAIESTIKEYRKFALKRITEAGIDLTVDQSLVLLYLNNYPTVTQKEIADLVFKDTASMTRMINTMVTKQYLNRSLNDTDRRRYKITLTDKAKLTLKKLPKLIQHNRDTALNGISEQEIQKLEHILQKIKKNCLNQ